MEHPVAASYLIMFGIGWHTYNCIFLSMYIQRHCNNSLKIGWSVVLFRTNKHNIVYRQVFIFMIIYRFLQKMWWNYERITILKSFCHVLCDFLRILCISIGFLSLFFEQASYHVASNRMEYYYVNSFPSVFLRL